MKHVESQCNKFHIQLENKFVHVQIWHLSLRSCEVRKMLSAMQSSRMQIQPGNCMGTCFCPGAGAILNMISSDWICNASSLSSMRLWQGTTSTFYHQSPWTVYELNLGTLKTNNKQTHIYQSEWSNIFSLNVMKKSFLILAETVLSSPRAPACWVFSEIKYGAKTTATLRCGFLPRIMFRRSHRSFKSPPDTFPYFVKSNQTMLAAQDSCRAKSLMNCSRQWNQVKHLDCLDS